MRVLLRVDAGRAAGLGHLVRCLALARALTHAGANCAFFTSNEVEARITPAGFAFASLVGIEPGSDADLTQTLAVARARQSEVVVVDSYHADAAYLARLRAAGLYVAAIDDLAAFAFPCQLVVNGSIYAETKTYASATGDTEYLLGPQYILLREDFWQVAPRPLRPRVENILVLLGGMDPLNLMPRLIQQLDRLTGDFQITAVVGPFFGNQTEILETTRVSRHRIDLVYDPQDTRDLILSADAAISAGGQTLHELLVCGCPTLALAVAENQAPNVRAWAERGAVLSTKAEEEDISPSAVASALGALMQDSAQRAALRANGRKWIDGQGARRVAAYLNRTLYGAS